MPCEVSSRRWSCLHRCRECLSRSHLRCVQHDGPADKPPIGDLLPRLGSSIRHPGAKLVVYPNMAGERGWANAKGDCCCAFTAYCIVDSRRRGDNLHLHLRKAYTEGMLFELPCSTFKRESNGDIVPTGVKIRLAGSLDEGEFNQRDFNRAAEEKCGKLQ
jgi:hypothetical protein